MPSFAVFGALLPIDESSDHLRGGREDEHSGTITRGLYLMDTAFLWVTAESEELRRNVSGPIRFGGFAHYVM